MSFIGGLFNTSQGNGYQAQGASTGQANAATNQANAALQQQQQLQQQLNGANGVANQSNAYDQFQGMATGQGPDVAGAALTQATNANVANTQGAIASQKGINPALAARMALQQGAATQQQSAGQAATLKANQQVAGIQGAAGIANNQVGQQIQNQQSITQGTQNEQANLLNSINNQNNANSTIANTNAQAQDSAASGIIGGAASAFGLARGGRIPMAEGGSVDGPSSSVGKYLKGGPGSFTGVNASGAPRSNAAVAESAGQALGGLGAKGLMAAGKALGIGGGDPAYPDQDKMLPTQILPQPGAANLGATGPVPPPPAAMISPMAGGGKVPVVLSPGEKYLNPQQAQAVKQGRVDPMKVGKTVPGKAPVRGDSYANDTVPAKLEKGGLVIPRSVMQSEAPMREAIKFVHAHMAKGGMVGGLKAKHKKASK